MSELNLVVEKPEVFFKEKVKEIATNIDLNLDENVEHYLVNLLCEYIKPCNINSNQDSDPVQTPLAFMLKQALEAQNTDKIKKYKKLGDVSLYYAGYFSDFVKKSTVDINYYVSMGSQAYSSAAKIINRSYGDNHFYEVYCGLSGEFRNLVKIISYISNSSNADVNKNSNLLNLYEKWIKTNSDEIKSKLLEEGIDPIKVDFRKH